jgi:hypothetical protein
MGAWVRYVVALLVVVHGLVYVNAARGVLPVFDGWSGTSWLLGDAVGAEALRRLALALWVVAGLGLVATGAAIGFALPGAAAWRVVAIVASAVGVLSFFVFWDGRADRLVAEGVLGMLASLAVLAAALALPRVLALAAT